MSTHLGLLWHSGTAWLALALATICAGGIGLLFGPVWACCDWPWQAGALSGVIAGGLGLVCWRQWQGIAAIILAAAGLAVIGIYIDILTSFPPHLD